MAPAAFSRNVSSVEAPGGSVSIQIVEARLKLNPTRVQSFA